MSQRVRVLFVDDDDDLLAGVKLGLRKSKMEVLTAHSADEAAAVLRETRVDVVVSDEQMPEVTGSRFLGFVRRNFPGTVRIALTGQASLEAVRRAVNEGGISRLLIKPCGSEELAEAIAGSLREREEAAAALGHQGEAQP